MRKRYRSHGLAFVVVLLAVGCGSRTGDVSGKVLYKGKPLSGGSVTFFHSKGASSSRIDSDGSYAVFKVPTGEAKITVQSLRAEGLSTPVRRQMIEAIKSGVVEREKLPPKMKEALESLETASSGTSPPLPPQYSDSEKSGLTYTVTSGKQTHDIELK